MINTHETPASERDVFEDKVRQELTKESVDKAVAAETKITVWVPRDTQDRSTTYLQDGWYIVAVIDREGSPYATVYKDDHTLHITSKTLPLEDLVQSCTEGRYTGNDTDSGELEKSLEKCKTIGDLREVLENTPKLRSGDTIFGPDYLVKALERAVHENTPNYLPHGVRATFEKLVK